ECRPSLDVVVAYKSKATALRIHRGIVVERAVLEMEDQTGHDPLSMDGLE
ncbi:MAG: hypothetical protein JO210_17685, partial [Acidobacteriaceae bacterium]|nr:hypothetical protein [Acidobacteriaceae bacterium]